MHVSENSSCQYCGKEILQKKKKRKEIRKKQIKNKQTKKEDQTWKYPNNLYLFVGKKKVITPHNSGNSGGITHGIMSVK